MTSIPDNTERFANKDPELSTRGNKFALVVGVNNCLSGYLSTLQKAEEDAYNICWALRQSACNFKSVDILVGETARTSDVRAAMINLVRGKNDQDFLLFYFVGHGQPMRTKDGYRDIYFATHDFDPNQVKIDANVHLCMRWLRDILYEAEGVGSVLIVLDCCYAGNMISSRPDLEHLKIDIDIRKIVDEVVGEHLGETRTKRQTDQLRVILTSTKHNRQAQERVMTSLLFPVLRGEQLSALDPNTGDVNIHSLYMYLQHQISPEDLPNLAGEFARKCVLASYPEKSHRSLELSREKVENERWNELPIKVKEQVSEVVSEFKQFLAHTDISGSQSFDHSLCIQASLEDLNHEQIDRFFKRERFLKEKPHLLGLSASEKLTKFGLANEGYPHPTYGALLCFGKDPQHWVSSALTRCTKWEGSDRLDNRLYDGDLLMQFEKSREFLQTHLDFTEVITREGTIYQYEIPMRVLEEALTNALVHREYKNQNSLVQVQIFHDRVEISSPGEHPLSLSADELGNDITSHPRNFQIATIFYLCGYIQEAGSGIPRIRRLMEEAGLPPPEFNIGLGRMFKVVLRRAKNYQQMNDRVGQQLKNYRLTHLLSKSNSSEVYLGEQLSSKSPVVIEIMQSWLSKDEHGKFLEEASVLNSLTHSNIVRVIDYFLQDNMPVLIMEYIPNGNLRMRYSQGERLSLTIAVPYISQIASALQYMHNQNLFHGNIKPENILVGAHGEVMIASLGSVIKRNLRSPREKFSNAGYQTSEQPQRDISAANDQYELAALLYEWLYGSPPSNEYLQEKSLSIERASVVGVNDVPEVIDKVVMKALAKDPLQRFENVLAFASTLEEAQKLFLAHEVVKQSKDKLLQEMFPLSKAAYIPPAKGNMFQIEAYFLRSRKYALFRAIVILLNGISSFALALVLNSPLIGYGCFILSCLMFISSVVLIKRSSALSFAIIFSLYWGATNTVLAMNILSRIPEQSVPVLVRLLFGAILGIISFVIASYFSILYVQNKNII